MHVQQSFISLHIYYLIYISEYKNMYYLEIILKIKNVNMKKS